MSTDHKDINWHNPPIDNVDGQKYLRLYAAVSNTQYPTQKELDEIVAIVFSDFEKPPPTQPIETGIVVNHSPSITTTITDNNIIN